MSFKLGDYFIVTSGYSEKGGLVSKSKEAILFLAVGSNLYRAASLDEIKKFQNNHPILK
ncbi:MAG: hypothetical protein H6912_00700 [Kordiimonadaceae bacterium]|nr:hypothetical protein [Kordiimonadaceae bacterium]